MNTYGSLMNLQSKPLQSVHGGLPEDSVFVAGQDLFLKNAFDSISGEIREAFDNFYAYTEQEVNHDWETL